MCEYEPFFIAVARIGFSPVNYQASETDGSILFRFSVLEGSIAFDVNVNFESSDGSALAMNDSGMHTHCYNYPRTM